jgi:WD40 repeat protein
MLVGHTLPVWALAELKEKIIASGSADFTIKIWNLENNECINTLYGHTMPVKLKLIII